MQLLYELDVRLSATLSGLDCDHVQKNTVQQKMEIGIGYDRIGRCQLATCVRKPTLHDRILGYTVIQILLRKTSGIWKMWSFAPAACVQRLACRAISSCAERLVTLRYDLAIGLSFTLYAYRNKGCCIMQIKVIANSEKFLVKYTMFKLLFIAAMPMHMWAYKILMIPIPVKSHVFGMAAMADGLASRGHKVTFFVGENYQLDIPELRNQTQISVVRYKDAADYDAEQENRSRMVLESGSDIKQEIYIMRSTYV